VRVDEYDPPDDPYANLGHPVPGLRDRLRARSRWRWVIVIPGLTIVPALAAWRAA
jgi:hypothetical protein